MRSQPLVLSETGTWMHVYGEEKGGGGEGRTGDIALARRGPALEAPRE